MLGIKTAAAVLTAAVAILKGELPTEHKDAVTTTQKGHGQHSPYGGLTQKQREAADVQHVNDYEKPVQEQLQTRIDQIQFVQKSIFKDTSEWIRETKDNLLSNLQSIETYATALAGFAKNWFHYTRDAAIATFYILQSQYEGILITIEQLIKAYEWVEEHDVINKCFIVLKSLAKVLSAVLTQINDIIKPDEVRNFE